MLSWTSSASLGCRGKDWLEDLQALTAQVRKFSVRIFIFVVVIVDVKRLREYCSVARLLVQIIFEVGGGGRLVGLVGYMQN
jgi:hypothetical protein